MADGNHEGEVRKKCPQTNEWCMGDVCAMRPELRRVEAGVVRVFRVCWVDALVILLSEINQKTQAPVRGLNIPPGLIRG